MANIAYILLTDTFGHWVITTNEIIDAINSQISSEVLANLTTDDKTSLVNAINELNAKKYDKTGGPINGNASVLGQLNVGKNGTGNTFLHLYDDTNDVYRDIGWDDASHMFKVMDAVGVMQTMFHAGMDIDLGTLSHASTDTNLRFKAGTKAQNDAYVGSINEITVELETPALRLHDGTTPGGTTLGGGSNTVSGNGSTSVFRNAVINGDMRFDQRKVGSPYTVSTSRQYTIDRWYALVTGSAIQVQQVAAAAPFVSALRMTGAAGNTSTLVGQRIEGDTCSYMFNQDMTLQAVLSASAPTTVTWSVYRANTKDSFSSKTLIQSGTVAVTTTPTAFPMLFNGGALPGNGIAVEFSTGPLGAGQTVDITGVQLAAGQTLTNFEIRPKGIELQLCQRYFQKSYDSGVVPGTFATNGIAGYPDNTNGGIPIPATVALGGRMRIAPQISYYDRQGAPSRYSTYESFTWLDGSNDGGIISVSETGFIFAAFAIPGQNNYNYRGFFVHYVADAEL